MFLKTWSHVFCLCILTIHNSLLDLKFEVVPEKQFLGNPQFMLIFPSSAPTMEYGEVEKNPPAEFWQNGGLSSIQKIDGSQSRYIRACNCR